MLYDYTGKSEDGVLELLPESDEDDESGDIEEGNGNDGLDGFVVGDEDEDDDMMYFIERQLEKPD